MKIATGLNAEFYARFYASEASGRAHWIAEDLHKGRHDRLRDDFGALCKNVMELRAMLDVIAPQEEAFPLAENRRTGLSAGRSGGELL